MTEASASVCLILRFPPSLFLALKIQKNTCNGTNIIDMWSATHTPVLRGEYTTNNSVGYIQVSVTQITVYKNLE